jgi:hypothetical protein
MKNLNMEVNYGVRTDWSNLDEWQKKANPYTVTLKYDRKQMTVPFFMGPAHTSEPTLEDVMPCLVADYSLKGESFEDFAANCGYDEDSRKAEKIYKQIQRQSAKLEKLLGPDLENILTKYQDM